MTATIRDMESEVLAALNLWLGQGQHCWLATVIKTWGSSPRPVGSLLAANESGQIMGSLSGGCVEDDLIAQLTRGALAKDLPEVYVYGLSAAETEKFGLPCGGHLHVMLEPVRPTSDERDHFAALCGHLAERRWIRREVDAASGSRRFVVVDGHAPLEWDESARILRHVFGPAWRLFIIGAGMVGRYLAHMALMLDYQVLVCDPRQHLLDDFDVDGVTRICDMPDDAIEACAKDPAVAIVATTHDPRIDDMGLMGALETRAFYVGAMGSARTSKSRRHRLRALDVDEAQLARLHAPVGLPIGSKTPAEIAVSILAEIIAERRRLASQSTAGARESPVTT